MVARAISAFVRYTLLVILGVQLHAFLFGLFALHVPRDWNAVPRNALEVRSTVDGLALEDPHPDSSLVGGGLLSVLGEHNLGSHITDLSFAVLIVIAVALVATRMERAKFIGRANKMAAKIESYIVNDGAVADREGNVDDGLNTLWQKMLQVQRQAGAERARWEEERKSLLNVFSTFADAILLIEADNTICFCNQEAFTLLGLPGGGLADCKPLDELLGTDHPLVNVIRGARASASAIRDFAAEIATNNMMIRFLASAFPLGGDADHARQLVIVRNVEPLRQFEGVTDYSSRWARLGGLIAGVAHQLRNPLNAMTLELELLNQDARDGKPVDGRVQMVRADMTQLAKAIDALVRFMRPEALKPERLSVNELVLEAARTVTAPVIRVVYSFDQSNPSICADRAVLTEAIRNLIHNAVEAMPGGGKLEIKTQRTEAFTDVIVSDNGCGISPDLIDRVSHLYITTKENGTGLGLPMALRAVELHGGFLKINSKLNAGTEVTIRLPLAKPT